MLNLPSVRLRWRESVSLGRFQNCNQPGMNNFRRHGVEDELGFEEQKRRIDSQISELRAMLSGGPAEPATTPGPTKRKRRKMSAAGRKAIAEAQRKRWAC